MGTDDESAYHNQHGALDGTIKHDRRRPGRREISPELIPLLRGTAPFIEPIEPLPVSQPSDQSLTQELSAVEIQTESTPLNELDDGGNPARGILIGVLLSIPFWVFAAVIVHWLL